MDLSADEWDNINTDSALAWVTSVNKNVLQQQIEKLGEEAGNQYKYGDASFKGEGLNSDLSSQLLSWSEKIMHANLSNPELAGLIEMNFVSYILEDNASFDFDDTFEKFANAMNSTVR